MGNISVRRPVAAGIAWTIIARIIECHGEAGDLRVLEMHPSGGQADLLTLLRAPSAYASAYDDESIRVGIFNLRDGRMSGFLPGSDQNVDWLSQWLENDDIDMVVDLAVQTLGLPVARRPLPLTRAMFSPCLLAGLLGSEIMKVDYLDARMGFQDSSGYGEGVRRDLLQFTSLYGEGEGNFRQAADCWLLYAGWERRLRGVLRMDGCVSTASAPHEVHDLFAVWERTQSVAATVAEAQKLVS